MHLPPPPESRNLLAPLLACLPTAFISNRPPPALLPLLSPLLRQRVNFLSANGSSRNNGWLPLLSWSGKRGDKLPEVVERMQIEPHPASGEVEIDEVRPAKYRRLDEETLHARLDVEQFELAPIYLWCETDEDPGWKLTELSALDDVDPDAEWFDSISDANDAAPPPRNGSQSTDDSRKSSQTDDDAYWAAYDRTPGRTPQQKRSPGPRSVLDSTTSSRNPSQAENEYFARYAQVQPALDAHDPDEEHAGLSQSNSRNGNSLHPPPNQYGGGGQQQQQQTTQAQPSQPTNAFPNFSNPVEAPKPISSSNSSSPDGVEKLEARARAISDAQASEDRAQTAIKQHISTDIKSLFRLAKNTGMSRAEFDQMVRKELDCLSLLEEDDSR